MLRGRSTWLTALYELYRICCRDEALVSVVEYVPDWVFVIVIDSVIDQRLIPIVFWIRFCINVPTMLLRTIFPYCDSDNIF